MLTQKLRTLINDTPMTMAQTSKILEALVELDLGISTIIGELEGARVNAGLVGAEVERANERVDALKAALAESVRRREEVEASEPEAEPRTPRRHRIPLGETMEECHRGDIIEICRPSARWVDAIVWTLDRLPTLSTAALTIAVDGRSAELITDLPGTYVVSGSHEAGGAVARNTTVVHVLAGGQRDRADRLERILVQAGAPVTGDLEAWASDVRAITDSFRRLMNAGGSAPVMGA